MTQNINENFTYVKEGVSICRLSYAGIKNMNALKQNQNDIVHFSCSIKFVFSLIWWSAIFNISKQDDVGPRWAEECQSFHSVNEFQSISSSEKNVSLIRFLVINNYINKSEKISEEEKTIT